MTKFEDTALEALAGLQKGQEQLQSDVRRLEVLHEETAEKIDQIIESVSPTIEKTNEHTEQLQDYENRITFVENAIKAV